VIKLILGIGDPLVGRLLLVDALGMKLPHVEVEKESRVPCLRDARDQELIDYDQVLRDCATGSVGPLRFHRHGSVTAGVTEQDGFRRSLSNPEAEDGRRQGVCTGCTRAARGTDCNVRRDDEFRWDNWKIAGKRSPIRRCGDPYPLQEWGTFAEGFTDSEVAWITNVSNVAVELRRGRSELIHRCEVLTNSININRRGAAITVAFFLYI